MENIISVRNLTKQFGAFRAVDNISFDVAQGEIFGFLGANGAGKTTAIRILCGLSRATSGTGSVAGCDIMTQSEDIKRNIGYMCQKFSLYEDLTVLENMELYGGIYGMHRKEILAKAEAMLTELEFWHHRHDLVRSIPAGWRQKLAFTVANLHAPKVIFLDEPTGGVDPLTRRQFWGMIRRAAAAGTTVFVTTHYMDEAALCDRVSIMVDGRIMALDTPETLISKYQVRTMDEVFRTLARNAVRNE